MNNSPRVVVVGTGPISWALHCALVEATKANNYQPPKLHKTYGVYPNGDFKRNAVREEDLENHILYNYRMRPGRALIVDGVLRLEGINCANALKKFAEEFKKIDAWKPEKATIPYR